MDIININKRTIKNKKINNDEDVVKEDKNVNIVISA